jgi:hypothetical protein
VASGIPKDITKYNTNLKFKNQYQFRDQRGRIDEGHHQSNWVGWWQP